jgi:streptomycin 6-kinase
MQARRRPRWAVILPRPLVKAGSIRRRPAKSPLSEPHERTLQLTPLPRPLANTMSNQLNHYLSTWQLSDPKLLAQTRTSHVYSVTRSSETLVLKLLTEHGFEEQRGALALRSFDGRGAVRLYQSTGDAQLLEYATGDELIILVERGDDEGATRIIAGVLAQLHRAPRESLNAGLLPLKDWFRELFDKAESDRAAGIDSLYVRGANLATHLLATPRDVCVLHGDIHHRNLRQSSRGWLAFDPKGLWGERTYDCANTLCNPFRGQRRHDPRVHDERRLLAHASIFADTLELDRMRVLQFTFAYACLSASWSLSMHDDDQVHWSLEIGRLLEPHVE